MVALCLVGHLLLPAKSADSEERHWQVLQRLQQKVTLTQLYPQLKIRTIPLTLPKEP